MSEHRYCVIGAGAAGLAATAVLREQGFDVVCFEKSERVGGHWHTDYESLHLITSRDVSGFDGYPMPDHFPVYPSRDQMRSYLEAFAADRRLHEVIRFGTEVTHIEPVGERGADGWDVETADGAIERFDGVLVANGHLWDPKQPTYPGTFTGTSMHSSEYHSIADIEGSRVLVIGAGNSGCDLAVDMANARLESFISLRRGQMFQPKAIFGRPRAEIRWLGRLPLRVQERVTRALIDVVVGPSSRYRGMPEPATRNLNDQPPVVNNLLLYWIHHGRITVVPGVERFEGRVVHFTDGTSREFDTILWATGFRVTLPFLDDALLTRRDGVPLRTAGLVLPVGLENLYFIGLAGPRGPQVPVYSAQAKLVARMLRLREAGVQGISQRFAAAETADSRIDILRPIWNRQMKAAEARLERMR
jgi:cation diffusion facilitator CzcD-associated flavoprotein CzcO